MSKWWVIVGSCVLLAGCVRPSEASFWEALEALCGQAFEGRLTEGTETAHETFGGETLVMHVQRCSPDELRVPFHVGADRSRTWVFTREGQHLRLTHVHRHADGSQDKISHYGGVSMTPAETREQRFAADNFTAELVPEARSNVWTVIVEPGERFVYALHREGDDRRARIEFDLGRALPVTPPPPWGDAPRDAQTEGEAVSRQALENPAWPRETVRYRCEGGVELQAAYLNLDNGGSFAALYYDGRLSLMRIWPGASGTRYVSTDEEVGLRWHTKGDRGTLSFLAADHTAQEITLLADCDAM